MSEEEILKWIREGIQNAIKHGQLTNDLMFVFLQLKILDKLDNIQSGLVDVENEISKLNPVYK